MTKRSAAVVDLAHIHDRLSRLAVAPLAVRNTTPMVPALRSCLKTVASAIVKHVSFQEYGGWNVHGLRAFQQYSPPITFLSLDEATLLQPTPYMVRDGRIHEDGRPSRTKGLVHPGHYRLVGAHEIRWPPDDHDGAVTDCQLPPYCRACAQLAGRGSLLTRYLPMQLTVRCSDCMSDASKRLTFSPALDHNGEEDELDTCSGEHTDGSCHYGLYATKADVQWLYANYPERYPGLDALLNG
jgi:hypothetical protein